MEEIVFNSQEELYKRILPALRSKMKRIHKDGYKSIKEIDIWDYMRLNRWNKSVGLELCDMVHDILNIPNIEIMKYYHKIHMPENYKIEEIELPKLKDISEEEKTK